MLPPSGNKRNLLPETATQGIKKNSIKPAHYSLTAYRMHH